MAKISNPHDKFFRSAMQNKQLAMEYMTFHLPEPVKNRIDLNSLEPTSESYVDEQMRQSFEDVVFRCRFKVYENEANTDENEQEGREGYICLLVEHQSTPDKLMAFRLHYYLFCLLNKHLKSHPEESELPVVYPMVCYHGEQSPYPFSRELLDCFGEGAELMRHSLYSSFQLIDIQEIKDDSVEQYH